MEKWCEHIQRMGPDDEWELAEKREYDYRSWVPPSWVECPICQAARPVPREWCPHIRREGPVGSWMLFESARDRLYVSNEWVQCPICCRPRPQ